MAKAPQSSGCTLHTIRPEHVEDARNFIDGEGLADAVGICGSGAGTSARLGAVAFIHRFGSTRNPPRASTPRSRRLPLACRLAANVSSVSARNSRESNASDTRGTASTRLGFTPRSGYSASARRRKRFSASRDRRGLTESAIRPTKSANNRRMIQTKTITLRSCHHSAQLAHSRGQSIRDRVLAEHSDRQTTIFPSRRIASPPVSQPSSGSWKGSSCRCIDTRAMRSREGPARGSWRSMLPASASSAPRVRAHRHHTRRPEIRIEIAEAAGLDPPCSVRGTRIAHAGGGANAEAS